MYRTATLNSNSWAGMALINDYKERTSYDANGNILTYLGEGFGASTSAMDSLSYLYNYSGGKLTSNRLNYVRDRIGNLTTHSSNYTDDIEDQAAGNYSYDAIGNLTSDAAGSITSILWNVYGKISRITRTATASNNVTQIRYSYDPSGNRISKAVAKSATDSIKYTFYARDASGNVMATYYGKDAPDWTIDTVTTGGHAKPPLYLQEQHLYGSSRLGVLNRNISIGVSTFVKPSILNFTRGNKFFELSYHLGNVFATISYKKIGVSSNSINIDYYNADVISATDYYPGGMQMPGRKYLAPNASKLRYGFNGKEMDNEVSGDGNQYDYGFRIYDPRLVRFKSVDPLFEGYPWNSPYSYAEGEMIRCIDLDGLEKYIVVNSYDKYGRVTKIRVESIVTVGSNAVIDQDFKTRGSNGDLTKKDIYTQHLKNGQFLANDESRNGGLTPNEALAYNTTITSNNRSSSFDSDNGIANGEDGELGNEFTTKRGQSAYSHIKGSKEGVTHDYKEGERRFTKTNARSGTGLINGVNYIKGTLSSAEGAGSTGGRLDIDYAAKYIKG